MVAPLFVLLAIMLRNFDAAHLISAAFLHAQAKTLAESVAGFLVEDDIERAGAAYRVLSRKLGGNDAADAVLRVHCGIIGHRLPPSGRPRQDAEAGAFAAAVDVLGLAHRQVLAALGLNHSSDSTAWGWSHRVLKRGRWLLARARPGLQSEISLIAWFTRLHANDPAALAAALAPYLAQLPAVTLPEMWVRDNLLADRPSASDCT